MGDYDLDAMSRRANSAYQIQVPKQSSGLSSLMNSTAGKIGMGFATGGASLVKGPAGNALGMYNAGKNLFGSSAADPMKGAESIQASNDTEFGGSAIGDSGVSGLKGAGSKLNSLDNEYKMGVLNA